MSMRMNTLSKTATGNEILSSAMEQHQELQVQWRRDKVQELCSKEYSQREIASILQVGLATVNRDISYLRNQTKTNIKKYIDELLPEEYEKCMVGLNAITKEACNMAQNTEDKREKIQALSLAKECYSMKLELLTNATMVDDAIKFVTRKSTMQTKSKADYPIKKSDCNAIKKQDDVDNILGSEQNEIQVDQSTINSVF